MRTRQQDAPIGLELNVRTLKKKEEKKKDENNKRIQISNTKTSKENFRKEVQNQKQS